MVSVPLKGLAHTDHAKTWSYMEARNIASDGEYLMYSNCNDLIVRTSKSNLFNL